MISRLLLTFTACLLLVSLACAQTSPCAASSRPALCRAQRPAAVVATLANDGAAVAEVKATLVLPEGVRLSRGPATLTARCSRTRRSP